MDEDILEDVDRKPKKESKPYTYIAIGIIFLLILAAGYYYIYKILPSRKVVPTPSPSSTEQIWKTKSEKNVTDFIDLWSKAISSTNYLQYALKARDLLSNVAQARLETYKDKDGKPITIVSEQLSKFIGLDKRPESIEIYSSTKIDEKNVEVRVYLFMESNSSQARVLVFNNINEGGIWLIDTITDKGIQTVESPKPSPLLTK